MQPTDNTGPENENKPKPEPKSLDEMFASGEVNGAEPIVVRAGEKLPFNLNCERTTLLASRMGPEKAWHISGVHAAVLGVAIMEPVLLDATAFPSHMPPMEVGRKLSAEYPLARLSVKTDEAIPLSVHMEIAPGFDPRDPGERCWWVSRWGTGGPNVLAFSGPTPTVFPIEVPRQRVEKLLGADLEQLGDAVAITITTTETPPEWWRPAMDEIAAAIAKRAKEKEQKTAEAAVEFKRPK